MISSSFITASVPVKQAYCGLTHPTLEGYCPPKAEASRTMERPFALVTGASRGLGAAYARALAERGYDLLLLSRDKDQLERLARELTARVHVELETMDLAEPEAGHRIYAAARARRHGIELVVHNAGFGVYGPFAEIPLPRIQQMLRLHLNAVLESMRLFLPEMIERRRGAMIAVSSIVGLFPVPYLSEYAASKAFLIHFCRALAEEVRPYGVTIQACCPGSTDTDFHLTAGFRSHHPFGMQTPAKVVGVSLKALQGRRTVVTIGWQGACLAALSRWIPQSWIARGAARWLKPWRS
jgi:short-subunit dehydrogenase